MSQNLALTATGAIWTRWCLIIKPRNILYVRSIPLPFPSFSFTILHFTSLPLDNPFPNSSLSNASSLAAVNFFLGIVGATQVTRILMYRRSLEESPIETAAESVAESVADTVSDAVAKVKK